MSDGDIPASALSPSHGVEDVTGTLLRLLNSLPDALHPAGQPISSLASLADGTCLIHFLHALEPQHFDLDSIQSTKDDASGKLTEDAQRANLQYLIDCLETFFEENMAECTMDLAFLDVGKLCSSDTQQSEGQLLNLLELVLLAAINSTNKETIIHEIMAMTDAEQQTLMNVIHEVQSRADKAGSGLESHAPSGTPPRRISFDSFSPSAASAANAAAAVTASSSSSSLLASPVDSKASSAQVSQLTAEKVELTSKLDAANRDVREWKRKTHELLEKMEVVEQTRADDLARATAQATQDAERAFQEKSKTDLSRASKELARSELRIQELEASVKAAQEQALLLTRELAGAKELAEERATEMGHVKDELHIAATKLEDLASTQAKFEKLKLRLGEMETLKQQLALSEADNSKQLDRIIELESEAKELDRFKDAINKMRDHALQADTALLDKTLAEEAARRELAETKEALALARQEHRAMDQQCKALRTELDQAKSADAGGHTRGASIMMSDDFADTEDAAAKKDDRTTIRRLEYELNKLRTSASASPAPDVSGEDAVTASTLALLKSQKDSLQEKYLEVQRKLAATSSDAEKARADLASRAERAERALEDARADREEADAASQKKLRDGEATSQARSEELAKLRQELSDLHEQMDQIRSGAAAAASATAAAALSEDAAAAAAAAAATAAAAAAAEAAARRSSVSAEATALTEAAAATQAADLEAMSLRNKKLEAYIKQSQKKMKLLEEGQAATQEQLSKTHEAYKTARNELLTRERELVDREKSRVADTANAARERKLISAAFYSIGFEYNAAMMTVRTTTNTPLTAPQATKHAAPAATTGRSWLSQQRANNQ